MSRFTVYFKSRDAPIELYGDIESSNPEIITITSKTVCTTIYLDTVIAVVEDTEPTIIVDRGSKIEF